MYLKSYSNKVINRGCTLNYCSSDIHHLIHKVNLVASENEFLDRRQTENTQILPLREPHSFAAPLTHSGVDGLQALASHVHFIHHSFTSFIHSSPFNHQVFERS